LFTFQPFFNAQFTMVATLPTRLQTLDTCLLIAFHSIRYRSSGRSTDLFNDVYVQSAAVHTDCLQPSQLKRLAGFALSPFDVSDFACV